MRGLMSDTTGGRPRVLTGLAVAALIVIGDGTAQPARSADPAGADARTTLVLGMVTNNPKRNYARLKPIVDYAAGRLGDLGITGGEVLLANTNDEMIRYLEKGRVDWVTESVVSALQFADVRNAELFLRRWKDLVPVYHTVFITRRDSEIHSLKDLIGRRIAFEDPGSTSSYFVPLAALGDAGLQLVELESHNDRPPADRIGYLFAGSEINIAIWVAKGRVSAGAYNNLDWANPDETLQAIRGDLRIFFETDPLPRAIELVRDDLDPAIKDGLREILLNAHLDPAAADALTAYSMTRRFDLFSGEAADSLETARRFYNEIRPMLIP